MDDWRIQQQQQQQQKMTMNNIGPMHNYRSRPTPYPHPQSVKTDFNSVKTSYYQPLMSSRTRSMPPYQTPSMYSNSTCPCTSHMYYPSQHPTYYQSSYPIKNKSDESSTSYYHHHHHSNCSMPAQQLTPIAQEYPTFSNQSQIFPSPPSNPSTPYQGEFNEFGVPYHHGQPSSVNSLTDALCPSGDIADRQLTPGPPSVGTPRVAQHQYSFPQTPSTPTTSRISNEQNIDELTAFLQDPVNIYLTDDFTSTLFDDIEVLADTYLGGNRGSQGHEQQQQSNVDNDLDYDIILNYLCSDDLISTVCKN